MTGNVPQGYVAPSDYSYVEQANQIQDGPNSIREAYEIRENIGQQIDQYPAQGTSQPR